MGNPFKGATYLLLGFRLIFKPGIRQYVVIPLTINVVLFTALIWFGASQFSDLSDWVTRQIPDWLQWLAWLLWIVFALGVLLVLFFCFSLLANLVAAPFNSLLADAVEEYATGTKRVEQKTSAFFANVIPSVANEIRKILYFLGWSIPFLILFFIPVVNIAAPVLWFLFSAWMLSVEYGDYPMGNHELLFPEQRRKLSQKRFLSLGFGSMVSFVTMIPIANFLVMPAAVAGATMLWVEQLKNKD